MSIHRLLPALMLVAAVGAQAAQPAAPAPAARTGFAQDGPKDPPMLKNLRLDDPLVRDRFLQNADLMRFIRGLYSDGCSRGMLVAVLKSMQHQEKMSGKAAAAPAIDPQRVWKMGSFEMEAIFGNGYRQVSAFCDCVVKEVANVDLVDPERSLAVLDDVPRPATEACHRLAREQHPSTPKL